MSTDKPEGKPEDKPEGKQTTAAPAMPAHRKAMREFDFLVRSRRPIIYIVTHEEGRVLDTLEYICRRNDHQWSLLVWDCANGLDDLMTPEKASNRQLCDPMPVLDWFSKIADGGAGQFTLLVLKDFHKFFGADGNQGIQEHRIIRQLRNLVSACVTQHKTLVLVGTELSLPHDLEKVCAVIDWPLPERTDINDRVEKTLAYAAAREDIASRFQTTYTTEEREAVVRACQGLTLSEVEMACTYAMITSPRLDPVEIASKKRDAVRKAGLLDWEDLGENMAAVGGLGNLKTWLNRRKDAFGHEAAAFGLPTPKGVLLLGVQGAGKSLASKAIASHWGMPLLRLDMGRMFSGRVGSSESNIRRALSLAEQVSPCVLWCDELDKGASGSQSSGRSDGGTASRVLGTLLTWMQDNTHPVFVVATANDVSQLPPELLRKGRFDETFFVDLPSRMDRAEIFSIHARKRGRDPKLFDISMLAEASSGFTGAEIEAALVSAMFEAFADGPREVTTSDWLKAIGETVPISVTMAERIATLRQWASGRARPASASEEPGGRSSDLKRNDLKRNDLKSSDLKKDRNISGPNGPSGTIMFGEGPDLG